MLEQVKRKTRSTCVRIMPNFGRKRNRSFTTGVNRSKGEAAPLPPSRVKLRNNGPVFTELYWQVHIYIKNVYNLTISRVHL